MHPGTSCLAPQHGLGYGNFLTSDYDEIITASSASVVSGGFRQKIGRCDIYGTRDCHFGGLPQGPLIFRSADVQFSKYPGGWLAMSLPRGLPGVTHSVPSLGAVGSRRLARDRTRQETGREPSLE